VLLQRLKPVLRTNNFIEIIKQELLSFLWEMLDVFLSSFPMSKKFNNMDQVRYLGIFKPVYFLDTSSHNLGYRESLLFRQSMSRLVELSNKANFVKNYGEELLEAPVESLVSFFAFHLI